MYVAKEASRRHTNLSEGLAISTECGCRRLALEGQREANKSLRVEHRVVARIKMKTLFFVSFCFSFKECD